MPTYTYRCDKCNLVFDKFHSMSETIEACEGCGSSVKRLLSKTTHIRRPTSSSPSKPGSIVRKYIEDVKEEVRQEKKKIKKQEYDSE